ncbi:phenylalanine--tRNA ligase subunit alpha [Candidatus Dependentiae bacterium]|nr:phenylalanine--tRNA ligase subunit alpha [Candidatus Dependentiae bacterium]
MTKLEQEILNFETNFYNALKSAQTEEDLEQLRLTFLSRSGQLANLMSILKGLSDEEKRTLGPKLNKLKEAAQNAFNEKFEKLKLEKIKLEEEKKSNFDVTAYKPFEIFGSLHPYTKTIEHIENILVTMGFEIIDGPEVDSDYYNFESLNIPKNHPARDMHDTFWLDIPHMLLRTHTSSVQAHAMQEKKLPLAVGIPGRTYRHEATDASHDFMFMQCEILLIDKNISLANLFATAKTFLQALFEKGDLEIRIRPGYFPFVEPGVEIDCTCPFCTDGCSVCKKTRWIELCGAGLIHPNVLISSKIDPKIYSGFAMGFGLTRLVMLKYGINDIRLLHSNKIDFLSQF